jgi:hypothetical protein
MCVNLVAKLPWELEEMALAVEDSTLLCGGEDYVFSALRLPSVYVKNVLVQRNVRASWRLGDRLMTTLPPLCSPRSPIPLPLRSAAAPPGAPAAPGRSRGAPCSSPSAMLTGTTLAGLMTGANFGPPKSLLEPSDERGLAMRLLAFGSQRRTTEEAHRLRRMALASSQEARWRQRIYLIYYGN